MTEAGYRVAILEEARSWLGTPYVNLGAMKGIGADCAMLLCRVYQTVVPHLVPATFDPRPYSPEWYLHRSEEKYLMGMEQYAHKVDSPQPGDLAAYRFGRTVSHASIIVDECYMIHANRLHGNVEISERAFLDSRLDSYWSVF